jgi:hypothetical protein
MTRTPAIPSLVAALLLTSCAVLRGAVRASTALTSTPTHVAALNKPARPLEELTSHVWDSFSDEDTVTPAAQSGAVKLVPDVKTHQPASPNDESGELDVATPTDIPTEPPLTCVTLLAPVNGADLPLTGKVTFSWTPLNEAGTYVLNIILPSGETLSFETDQTFRDRYMEAFVAGGKYQWQVIAQGADGSDICVSEVSTFDKPAYEKPKGGGNDGNGGNGGCTDPFRCGGPP